MLSALGGVSSAVVAYSVSRTFTGFVRQIVTQFCHPIGAEMARQAAISDRVRMRRVFMGAGRLVGGTAGLFGGFTLVVAGPFLHIWTRGEVAFDPWLIGAFIATIILMAPAQVALMIYQYNNRPGILVIAQGAYMVGITALCLLLIKDFSATGAAAGAGIAEFLSIGLLLPYAATKEVSVSLWSYFTRSYAAALGAFVLSYGVARGWNTVLDVHGLVGMIELSMLWAAVITVPAFFLLLESQERQWVLENVGERYAKLYRGLRLLQSTKVSVKKDRQR
jgi:O-antigen/teichoic acid export membrane protein